MQVLLQTVAVRNNRQMTDHLRYAVLRQNRNCNEDFPRPLTAGSFQETKQRQIL